MGQGRHRAVFELANNWTGEDYNVVTTLAVEAEKIGL